MATGSSSGDKEIESQISNILKTAANDMESKANTASSLSANEAENFLDEACNGLYKKVKSEVEELKATVRRNKPNPSSATYSTDKQKYDAYITAVATSIKTSTNLVELVFQGIRDIVSTVIDWIRAGAAWAWDRIADSFNALRSLWSN